MYLGILKHTHSEERLKTKFYISYLSISQKIVENILLTGAVAVVVLGQWSLMILMITFLHMSTVQPQQASKIWLNTV